MHVVESLALCVWEQRRYTAYTIKGPLQWSLQSEYSHISLHVGGPFASTLPSNSSCSWGSLWK